MTCSECGENRTVNMIPGDNGFICDDCMSGAFECVSCDKPIPFDEDCFVHGTEGCDKVCRDCGSTVSIEWGWDEQKEAQAGSTFSTTEIYTFTSQEARDAFILGIEEAVGWQGYLIIRIGKEQCNES